MAGQFYSQVWMCAYVRMCKCVYVYVLYTREMKILAYKNMYTNVYGKIIHDS